MMTERILGLGTFELHDNFFIGRVDEGVNAGEEFIAPLSSLIQRHYGNKPIGYISDRVNSYSLCPIATNRLMSENNIRYAAIVTYQKHQKMVVHMEKMLLTNTSVQTFEQLGEAVDWVKTLLESDAKPDYSLQQELCNEY